MSNELEQLVSLLLEALEKPVTDLKQFENEFQKFFAFLESAVAEHEEKLDAIKTSSCINKISDAAVAIVKDGLKHENGVQLFQAIIGVLELFDTLQQEKISSKTDAEKKEKEKEETKNNEAKSEAETNEVSIVQREKKIKRSESDGRPQKQLEELFQAGNNMKRALHSFVGEKGDRQALLDAGRHLNATVATLRRTAPNKELESVLNNIDSLNIVKTLEDVEQSDVLTRLSALRACLDAFDGDVARLQRLSKELIAGMQTWSQASDVKRACSLLRDKTIQCRILCAVRKKAKSDMVQATILQFQKDLADVRQLVLRVQLENCFKATKFLFSARRVDL